MLVSMARAASLSAHLKIESANPEVCLLVCQSSAAFAQHNNFNGIDQNDDIEKQTMVFYIVKVVLQLLDCVLHRSAVLITDLSPAGYSWLNAMPDVVKGDLGTELIYEIGPFRTRPDKTHVSV